MVESGRWVLGSKDRLAQFAEASQGELHSRMVSAVEALRVMPAPFSSGAAFQQVLSSCEDRVDKLESFVQRHGIIDTAEKEEDFAAELNAALTDDAQILRSLHQALAAVPRDDVSFAEADPCLERFVKCRTAWRLIADNHLALRTQYGLGLTRVGVVGAVDPKAVADDCFYRAQSLCIARLGRSAACTIEGDCRTFQYVPGHLTFVLFELVKNALHATVRGHLGSTDLPEVVLRVTRGNGELEMVVEDQGDGMPESIRRHAGFGFTTANGSGQRFAQTESDAPSFLSGWGLGVPVSRCLVEYLGGTLTHRSNGCGVDAVLRLPESPREHFVSV